MSLKPLADRVLIKPDAAEQKTASGLYIASNAQEKPQRGTVVAVGAGKLNDKGERLPLDVHEGDVVIYGKFGGNEIKVDGEDYLLMRADDIYAVVEVASPDLNLVPVPKLRCGSFSPLRCATQPQTACNFTHLED